MEPNDETIPNEQPAPDTDAAEDAPDDMEELDEPDLLDAPGPILNELDPIPDAPDDGEVEDAMLAEETDEDEHDPDDDIADPPAPIAWDLLTPEQAEDEWVILNEWVHWLRKRFALPAVILPPFWYRHGEMVEELSALHTHYLGAYHPRQDGSAPIGWMTDFAATKERLRDLVTVAGTRLDRDRPTRQTIWPGEDDDTDNNEVTINDREADFRAFVAADIERRYEYEATLDELETEAEA